MTVIAGVLVASLSALLSGCGGQLFPSYQPEAQLQPPPGTYRESIRVHSSGGPQERLYWSPDPRASIDDFEPFWDLYIASDTTFRYYSINERGIRSAIIEAEYTIEDEGAPVIEVPELYQANISYFRFDLIWNVVPPWDTPDGQSDPFDEVTDWEFLEYAVYSSPANDIDSLSAARSNGRLEMSWLTTNENPAGPAFRYFASRPGEPRYFNVFVRDAEGNTSGYGTRRFATRPALSVYIGTGTVAADTVWQAYPSFASRPRAFPEAVVRAVDLRRIDGDPYEDLAVVRSDGTSDYYRWYRAQGDGTFDETAPVAEVHVEGQSPNPREIRIADMTGDGTPDLVYNTALRDLQVSTASGGLVAAFPANAEGLTIGDIDNDGLNDIVSSAISIPNVRVWRNTGGTAFSEVLQSWDGTPGPGGLNPRDVQLADLDRDGNLDLVVAVAGALLPDPTVNIAWGQGDGTFIEATGEEAYWNVEHDTQGVAVADYDRDGDPDLFFSNGAPPSLLYINNGDRTFSPGPNTGSASIATGAIAADMNGDGWPDVVENHGGDVRIWINTEGSGIDPTPNVFTADSPRYYDVGRVR